MTRTINFHNTTDYHKWLAYGHIHHKFHGQALITINGKKHAVVHKPHHKSKVIYEHKENGVRTIQLKVGHGTGIMIQGARSNKPYRTGRTKVPNNIWHGGGGLGVIKMPKIDIRL